MNELGVVSFYFSEDLKPIEDLDQLNLTILSSIDVFEVEYHTMVQSDEEQSPTESFDQSQQSKKDV